VKALIVRMSSIGDVVHTLPALSALSSAGHRVGWLVEPPARSLVVRNPLVGPAVVVPPAKRFHTGLALEAVRRLRAERFDVSLDFQGLWKSAAWAWLSGARRVIGFSADWRREGASQVLVGEAVPMDRRAVHVIDKNLALLAAVGIDAVGHREFPLPPADIEAAVVAAKLRERGLDRFALLSPGGGWTSKLWPAERFGLLARGLRAHGLRSLVAWGPAEEDLAQATVAASDAAAEASWPSSLLEFAELARRAAVVVAADTGPLHLACAVGAPVVGLFGPTDPVRNGPFSADDAVVRRLPACAPCHKRVCPVHSGTMAEIGHEEVLAAVLRRLGVATERSRAL
jgi:heptosyltransferase-1